MNTDEQNAVTQPIVNTNMIHEGINFAAYSLLDLACMVESEITGKSIAKFKDAFQLQMIVLQSQVKKNAIFDLEKLQILLTSIYQNQGFNGDWKTFFKVENALLSSVLARRKGIPISLGILLIEMLTKIGFQAQGICFPNGFIVKVTLNFNSEAIYIDPFIGEIVNFSQLELKVRGQLGNHARLTSSMLEADNNETILKRYINVLKSAYVQADNIELALLCSDILLRSDPEDAYEVRSRGFLFQQLDCFQLACNDFTYFIEHYPEDPIVNLLKQQINKMNDEYNSQVIH